MGWQLAYLYHAVDVAPSNGRLVAPCFTRAADWAVDWTVDLFDGLLRLVIVTCWKLSALYSAGVDMLGMRCDAEQGMWGGRR